jgi:hypothetical protein
MYGLATWRVSNMIVHEAGPFDMFVKFRELWGVKHYDDGTVESYPDGVPVSCIWCTSVWVGLVMLLMPKLFAAALAMSAVAVFGDKYGKG